MYPSVASVAEGYWALLDPTSARLIGPDSLGAPRRLAATAKAFYDAGAPDEAERFQRAAWDVLKRFYGEPYQTQATEHAEAIETLRRLPKQLGDETKTLLLFEENDSAKQEAKRKEEKRKEAERKAREEAVRKAKAEAERKAKEEAKRKAREEVELRRKLEETRRRLDAELLAERERNVSWLLPSLRDKLAQRVDATPASVGASNPKAGTREVLTIKGVDFAFRWRPAGTFQMGSPSSEADRDSNETRHEVTLTKGFWMLETSVTQGMYRAITGSNPSYFKSGDNYPVENVSWFDSQSFCKALNALGVAPEGFAFRLPTEAEWEYACRAGTTGAYNVDGKPLDALGWYGVNSGGKTRAVGGKCANAWGLYNMHGNVWEWCADWFGDYGSGAQTNPTGPTSGSSRGLRGGTGSCNALNCRSADRDALAPTSRFNDSGFRLVLGR